MTLLERIDGGVNKAGSGIDLAALGISHAVSGLEQAVGTLESSLPSLSDSASALRSLTERLSGVAIELATELPKATQSLQEVSPELASVVGLLDERFTHLDDVVTEMARLVEASSAPSRACAACCGSSHPRSTPPLRSRARPTDEESPMGAHVTQDDQAALAVVRRDLGADPRHRHRHLPQPRRDGLGGRVGLVQPVRLLLRRPRRDAG